MNRTIEFNKNCFDLIRIVAACQVLLVHAVPFLQLKMFEGPLYDLFVSFRGVLIFFCLSGYLTMASFERNPSIKIFLKKRILRIYPALCFTAIFTLFLILLTYKWTNILDIVVWLVGQFTVGQFYTPTSLSGWGCGAPNGSLWTISIEMQFYILLPFLYKWLKDKKILYWIVCVFVFMFLNFAFGVWQDSGMLSVILTKMILQYIFPHLYAFFIGMFIYKFKDIVIRYLVKYFWIVLFIFLGWSILFNLGFIHFNYVYINCISGALICLLTIGCGYKFKPKRCKNDYSYGIYLIHMPIINVFISLGWTGKIQYLLLIYIISAVYSYLIVRLDVFMKNHLSNKYRLFS